MKTRGKLTEGILDGILKLILKGRSNALNKAFNNDPTIQKATKETEEALDTWEQTLVKLAKQGSPSASIISSSEIIVFQNSTKRKKIWQLIKKLGIRTN